jgi:hypothetical protein
MAKVGWLEHQKCPDYPVHCSSQERSLCLETKVDGQKGCFTHNIYYLSDRARHALQITTNFHGSPSFPYSLSKRKLIFHSHVVCLVEFPRQCIRSYPENFSDRVTDAGESGAKHLLLPWSPYSCVRPWFSA